MSFLDKEVASRQYFLFDIPRSNRVNWLRVRGLPYPDIVALRYLVFPTSWQRKRRWDTDFDRVGQELHLGKSGPVEQGAMAF